MFVRLFCFSLFSLSVLACSNSPSNTSSPSDGGQAGNGGLGGAAGENDSGGQPGAGMGHSGGQSVGGSAGKPGEAGAPSAGEAGQGSSGAPDAAGAGGEAGAPVVGPVQGDLFTDCGGALPCNGTLTCGAWTPVVGGPLAHVCSYPCVVLPSMAPDPALVAQCAADGGICESSGSYPICAPHAPSAAQ